MRRALLLFLPLTSALASVAPATAQLATGPQLLVTSQWLRAHQEDRDLIVLEVARDTAYAHGHIAGAVLDADSDMSTASVPGALSLEMPPEAVLRANLERLGISDRSRVVVVFDGNWMSVATRAFFTLGYAGLGDRAVFLDGGMAAWRRAGYPITTEVRMPTKGTLTSRFLPAVIVDHQYVAAHRTAVHAQLVDARAPQFYTGGTYMGGMLAGHIPGAVNLPYSTVVDSTSTLLPVAEVRARLRAAGVQPGDTVVAYCHVGQQATQLLLAARVAGYPTRLYDGSFQDWSMRQLPTEGGKP